MCNKSAHALDATFETRACLVMKAAVSKCATLFVLPVLTAFCDCKETKRKRRACRICCAALESRMATVVQWSLEWRSIVRRPSNWMVGFRVGMCYLLRLAIQSQLVGVLRIALPVQLQCQYRGRGSRTKAQVSGPPSTQGALFQRVTNIQTLTWTRAAVLFGFLHASVKMDKTSPAEAGRYPRSLTLTTTP